MDKRETLTTLLVPMRFPEILLTGFVLERGNLFAITVTQGQCGFKLVHKDAARRVLHKLSVDRFAWDVELLLAANDLGIPTFEVPVVWEHQEGSRIHVLRDGVEMGVTLMKDSPTASARLSSPKASGQSPFGSAIRSRPVTAVTYGSRCSG